MHWNLMQRVALLLLRSVYHLVTCDFHQMLSASRPTSSALCRRLASAGDQRQPHDSAVCCNRHCHQEPAIRLLSCQHGYCKQCLHDDVIESICKQQFPLLCQVSF